MAEGHSPDLCKNFEKACVMDKGIGTKNEDASRVWCCSELCADNVQCCFDRDIEFEKVDSVTKWLQYDPNSSKLMENHSKRDEYYRDILLNNMLVVADFCVGQERKLEMITVMNNVLKEPQFKTLMASHPLEFKSQKFVNAVKESIKDNECVMTDNIGMDVNRSVFSIMFRVLCSLQENQDEVLYPAEISAQSVISESAVIRDRGMTHRCSLIRLFSKLICLDEADEKLTAEDDRHKVWKSVIVHLASYAGVLFSLNGESKRFFLKEGQKRAVVSKADLEVQMTFTSLNAHLATMPRIIIGVYTEPEDKGDSSDQQPSADNESPVNTARDSNLPSLNNADKSGTSGTANSEAELNTACPDELHRTSWVKHKLFGQHAAQLLTVKQTLDADPRVKVNSVVNGMFMHNEKIFFTKLTGSKHGKTKFQVSNWYLSVDRFADRILFMVFLRVYCNCSFNT